MTLQTLLAAMVLVESSGNDSAIGDHGRAHGALQLHKACIADVNRFTGTHYSLADAHNRAKALKIAERYMAIWATEKRLGHKPTDFDRTAVFHLGPDGPTKPMAIRYWRKVRKHLPK